MRLVAKRYLDELGVEMEILSDTLPSSQGVSNCGEEDQSSNPAYVEYINKQS